MLKGREVAAVVVAAGQSARMGFDKLFYGIEGKEVLRHTVGRMDAHPAIDRIVVVAGDNMDRVRSLLDVYPPNKPFVVVKGGTTRMDSVARGVAACPTAYYVAIQDGARPFTSQELISRTLQAAAEVGAAAPGVPARDTIKQLDDDMMVMQTVPRERLVGMQTPQVFDRAAFCKALAMLPQEAYPAITDDCMVMERAGLPVRVVPGEAANRKITIPEDLQEEPKNNQPLRQRIGHGYDVHRLVEGRPLILGGVNIPFEKGLLGHSDADVLLHAVADALLGAAAMGDIGKHFPDTDEAYRGADSTVLLAKVHELLVQQSYRVQNIDATVLCQRPKLAPHIDTMRLKIADVLQMPMDSVNVKATTEEGLGFTGSGEGIAAHCVALLQG